MTETTVDKLKIDISAQTNESAENIDKVSRSIKNLYDTLKLIAKPLSAFSHQIKNVGSISLPKDRGIPKTDIPETVKANDGGGLGESPLPKATGSAEHLKKTVGELAEEIKRLKKPITAFGEETPKETKKAERGFKKFFSALKRVAFYRVVRAILKNIAQAFRDGMDNLAMYSNEANDAFSKLSTSSLMLKNSLASALLPVITAITPILVRIIDTLSLLLNNLSMVFAYMSGDGTYLKAIKNNQDYAKSLKGVSAQLLSFDKFESLNKGTTNPFENFEKADIDVEKAKSLKDAFTAIGIAIGLATVAMIIFNITTMANPIILIITAVIVIIGAAIALIVYYWDEIKAFFVKLGEWFVMVGEKIKTLFTNVGAWIVTTFKKSINTIANIFSSFINFFIKGINALIKPISKISEAFGGKSIEIPLIPTLNWGGVGSFFANGGVPKQGSYFYAGEAGAELVSKSPSGETGVTNIAQFKQAMIEALYEYGVMQNGGIEIVGTVKAIVDGQEIASSTRFRNEMNRRNPNLSLA